MKHLLGKRIIPFLIMLLMSSCAKVYITPVNFGWAAEEELKVSGNNTVTDTRNSIFFDLEQVLTDENVAGVKSIRMIRDRFGFYYLTAQKFKNVYVLKAVKNSFFLEKKIAILKRGSLINPAFNQRKKYIELVYGKKNKIIKLTAAGVVGGK